MRHFFVLLTLALWAFCQPVPAGATQAESVAEAGPKGPAAATPQAAPHSPANTPPVPDDAQNELPLGGPPAILPVNAEDGWVIMPAGARPTYMGIHGGTMPVSLLVSDDGSSLVTFVGRTGNDFLEILRRTDLPMPSLLNATALSTGAPLPTANGSVLMAGSAASSIPVFNLPGGSLAGSALNSGQLQPFGLSDKPLSIEGQVTRPPALTPVRQYRLLFRPQYLQPRRTPR